MTFSQEWDAVYKTNAHMSIWPWSDLVSYVMRYARPSGQGCRVLELGCGAGANIPFLKSLNVEYYGIEGSHTVVSNLWERFPSLKNNIIVGDFTKEIQFSDFDMVVDRSSLTHNTTKAIKRCLSFVYSKLKPGGKFVGIDWFSTLHSDYKAGVAMEDPYTRGNYTQGQAAGVGHIHFSDKEHLKDLFRSFTIEIMEHKIIKREIPEDNHVFASWNLIAKKD